MIYVIYHCYRFFYLFYVHVTFIGWYRNPSPLLGRVWWTCRFGSRHHGLQASSPPHQRPFGRNLPLAREPQQCASYLLGQERQPVPSRYKEGSCTGTRGPRCCQRFHSTLSHGESCQFGEPGDGSYWDRLQTDGEQMLMNNACRKTKNNPLHILSCIFASEITENMNFSTQKPLKYVMIYSIYKKIRKTTLNRKSNFSKPDCLSLPFFLFFSVNDYLNRTYCRRISLLFSLSDLNY